MGAVTKRTDARGLPAVPMLAPKCLGKRVCCGWAIILNRVVGNDHFCDTTERVSQRLTPHIKGEIPLYHRSGAKPLDPTTLILN